MTRLALLLAISAAAAARAEEPAVVPAVTTAVESAPVPAAPAPAAIPVAPAAKPVEPLPIRLTGYFWTDTGYMQRTNSQAGQYDQSANYMQGRFVLAGEYGRTFGDYQALARVEFLGLVNEYAKSHYEPHTLDAYLRFGTSHWDLQVGRFLAQEIYFRGQGIELWTAEEAGALGGPSLYLLDYTRGFKDEAGQAAIHLKPCDFLLFELAGVYGQESNQNNLGVRPVLAFDKWGLKAVVGAEYLSQKPQTEADKVAVTSSGFAGSLRYQFPYVLAGLSASRASAEYTDIQGLVDTSKTLDKWSAGAFVDVDFWKNTIGLGYHHTDQTNQRAETNTHDQFFASYLFRLPVDGLSVKAVYGYAQAHVQDVDAGSSWNNGLQSFRVRVAYDFK